MLRHSLKESTAGCLEGSVTLESGNALVLAVDSIVGTSIERRSSSNLIGVEPPEIFQLLICSSGCPVLLDPGAEVCVSPVQLELECIQQACLHGDLRNICLGEREVRPLIVDVSSDNWDADKASSIQLLMRSLSNPATVDARQPCQRKTVVAVVVGGLVDSCPQRSQRNCAEALESVTSLRATNIFDNLVIIALSVGNVTSRDVGTRLHECAMEKTRVLAVVVQHLEGDGHRTG